MTPISQEPDVLRLHLKMNTFMQKHFCSMLIDQNIIIYAYPKCLFFFFFTPKGGWCVFLASVKKIDLMAFKVSSDIKGTQQRRC